LQTLTRDKVFDTTDVVQTSLDPFLEPFSPTYFFPNTDAALITFRLTKLLPSGQTVLGVNFSHLLGDAHLCCRLLNQLSLIYSDGGIDRLPLSDWPVYGPSIALGETEPIDVSHPESRSDKRMTYDDYKVVLDSYAQVQADYEGITVSFSPKEIVAMKREAQERGMSDASSNDVTIAWWTTLMERGGEGPFRVVSWAINVSETTMLPVLLTLTVLRSGNFMSATLHIHPVFLIWLFQALAEGMFPCPLFKTHTTPSAE
jgi:hypothetical protein